MKTLQTTLTIATLTLSLAANARIQELPSFADAAPMTDAASTLVIFDLDNTLIEPVQTIGSDQWGSLEQKRLKDQGVPADDAIDQGVAKFAEVQMKTKVQLVDPNAAKFIKDLQNKGYTMMGLTARPLSLIQTSLNQLKSVGINLAPTAPIKGAIDVQSVAPARFQGGVLVVGPHNNKGDTLKAFYAKLGRALPEHVIFFDDKLHNVEALETALTSIPGVDYIGYRFATADETVKSFDSKLGDFEWSIFKSSQLLLNDGEARQLMDDQSQQVDNKLQSAERLFRDDLAGSSDLDSGSKGCLVISENTIECKGYITSLMHGGHRVRENITEQYIFIKDAQNNGSFYLLRRGDLN